jgi:hypothetical protein
MMTLTPARIMGFKNKARSRPDGTRSSFSLTGTYGSNGQLSADESYTTGEAKAD